MKHIQKQQPPQLLEAWKIAWRAKNGATLEDLYEQEGMTGKKLWAALGTSERKERLYSKEQLRIELLKEQGHLCCYCNRSIDLSNNSIEHFLPKGNRMYFKHAYDYNNLFLSCDGFAKEPRPRNTCCNEKRLENELLPLSPLQEDIETHFTFAIDGQIIGNTKEAEEMIQKLGLDIQQLADLRQSFISHYIYENPFTEPKEFISVETAKQKIEELKKIENKPLIPFAIAIQKVIESEIL
jgi:uncharacterized protein (TIGR02646 family)